MFRISLIYLLSLISFQLASQCSVTPIDLRTWSQLGPLGAGNWAVDPSGSSVYQSINGQNTFFASPEDFINVEFTGLFRTDDGDDDQMGFCFGIVGNPEVDATYSYFKLQWDQGGAGNGMYLREINETGTVSTLYSNPGFYWVRGFNHAFRLVYTAFFVEIYIDGNFISRVDGDYVPGKFGFFNLSQSRCTYSNPASVNHLVVRAVKDTVCLGDTTHLQVIGDYSSRSTSYYDSVFWDFGDGSPIQAGNGSLIHTYHIYDAIGDYTVNVTTKDRYNCFETVSIPTRIENGFPASLGLDTTICLGEQLILDVSTTPPNIISSYEWYDATTTANNTVNTSGSYFVTVRNQFQCIGKDTIQVTVPDSIKINVSTTNLLCFEDNTGRINFTASGSVGAPYQFELNNSGIFSSVNNFNGLASGSYTITARDGIGCLKDTLVTLTEPALLQISQAYKKDERCFDLCDGRSAFTAVGGTRPYAFTATGGNEIFDSIFINLCDENFMAKITDAHGCQDSMSFEIIGQTKVSINSSIDSICVNSPITIGAEATGGIILAGSDYVYNWRNNGSIQGKNLSNVFPTKDTIYQVFAVDDSLCHSDTISLFINVDPVIDFTSPLPDSCVAHRVIFQPEIYNNIQIANCRWDYGIGQFSDICVDHTWDYKVPGLYDVSYTVTTNSGCQTTITKDNFVEIYPLPIPDFSFASSSPPENATVFNPYYDFENLTTGATNYYWKMDSLEIVTDENPSYTFPEILKDKTYDITLIAISDNNCTDSITKKVIIENQFFMYIPNSFTPNGDGVNDLFYPTTNGITFDTYRFSIYDRWGTLVFSTTDQNHVGWDGRVKGKVGETSIYTWRLTGFIYLNTDRERLIDDYGTITILR